MRHILWKTNSFYNLAKKENSTNMLAVHAGPRLLNSSLSFEFRQLSSRSWASVVGRGAITRDASPPDDPPGSTSVRLASTISDNGTKRKCTSSGALGSRMFPFSRAYSQQMTEAFPQSQILSTNHKSHHYDPYTFTAQTAWCWKQQTEHKTEIEENMNRMLCIY